MGCCLRWMSRTVPVPVPVVISELDAASEWAASRREEELRMVERANLRAKFSAPVVRRRAGDHEAASLLATPEPFTPETMTPLTMPPNPIDTTPVPEPDVLIDESMPESPPRDDSPVREVELAEFRPLDLMTERAGLKSHILFGGKEEEDDPRGMLTSARDG